MSEKTKKEEFVKLYKQHIKRDGADKFFDYLSTTDFFSAPASTKSHSNVTGGLVEHSVNVFHRFKKLIEQEKLKLDIESIAVIALLHDVCKANYYAVEMRNTKEEKTGEWIKKPYFAVKDQLPYGHGEKSVYIISGFLKLSREESMAINWHMGGFDARASSVGSYTLSQAYYQYPVAFLFHIADMMATYLDEKVFT